MPGIIENEEPRPSKLHVAHISDRYRGEHDFVVTDIESFVDTLRFMGVERGLVDEADRRLRANRRDGSRWVAERLRELEPSRKAPSCDCGEPLVDVEWRGRATVRCSECGARWGVEVIDGDNESLWSIGEATDEWRAAHPVIVDDDKFPCEDVIRNGLPPVPWGGIERGVYFPVATWQAARHAAVLYVHRLEPNEFDWPGDEYENEIEHLVLGVDGEWTSPGSGGGGWVNVFDPPTDLLEKYVLLGTGTSSVTAGDDRVYATGGLCSAAVAAVETFDQEGERILPMGPDRPFFVVGVVGRGRVRVLGKDGDVLRDARGRRLQFDLGG